MVNLLHVQKAINRHLKQLYPEFKVYMEDVPQGFVRPSFFIGLISSPSDQMGTSAFIDHTPMWQIICFMDDEDKNKNGLQYMSSVCDSLLEARYLTTEDNIAVEIRQPINIQKLDTDICMILRTRIIGLMPDEDADTPKINEIYQTGIKMRKEDDTCLTD